MDAMKRLQRDMLFGMTALMLLAGCRSGVDSASPAGTPAGGVTFYVSPKGQDAWSGGLPVPNRAGTDGPFATLARARDAVRALKAAGSLSARVTVLLRAGRYYVTEPLRLGPEDSGTESCPITYAAYPKETPELIGGRRLTGFLPARNGQMSLSLPEVKAGTWMFRSLFINNERQIRARYPNIDPAAPCRLGFLYNGNKGSATVIACRPDVFKPAWLAPGAEVHVFQSGSCRAFMEIVSIQGYDPETQAIRLRGPECQALLAAGDRYCVENVYEELDSPGEWYLNRQTGVLSCLPKPGFTAKSEVIAPTVGRLFDIQGADGKEPVSYLRLSGLTLRCTDWELGDGCAGYGMGSDGVIYFGNAVGCAVENCEFLNIGKNAVCITGGRGNRVEGCEISHGAGGGVLILDSPGNTVTDNHIHHCGEGYKHNGGVVMQGPLASGNTVSHNAIHDMPRYGISLKNPGSTNVVEYNRVQNTSMETHDTGAIEVTQADRNFRSGSVIRGNLVADSIGYSTTSDKPCFMSWGIYLDSFAGGYEVTGNITYRNSHGGIMLQGGKDNRVTNNIFVESREMQGLIANYVDNSRGEVLERNIFYWTGSNAVLFATGKLLTLEVIRVDSNLIFQAGATTPRMGWGGWKSFADWQERGFDTHSVYADPLFVDPANDDYTLRPGSPAFKLGFAAIDACKIGPVKRHCSCTIVPAGPIFWAPRPAAVYSVVTLTLISEPGARVSGHPPQASISIKPEGSQ